MTVTAGEHGRMLRRGFALEWATLGWNVIGIVVLTVAATRARSVALAGFGLDSLIEIGASTVVVWELRGEGEDRQRRALRLIGGAFLALAVYLAVQPTSSSTFTRSSSAMGETGSTPRHWHGEHGERLGADHDGGGGGGGDGEAARGLVALSGWLACYRQRDEG